MKILYAVQATGNGHIVRAREMASAFKKHNIQVDWVFSGRDASAYFDMQDFGDYKTFRGLSFNVKNNRLDFVKTIFNADFIRFYRDIKLIDLNQYDLLINDFEPITAWAAKSHKINSIGLSHQAAFLYKIPFVKTDPLFNLIIEHYAPTKLPIGIHWQQFHKHIIPPIISKNPNKIEYKKQDIVVYLPFHSTDEIIKLFHDFPSYNFNIFHNDKPKGNFGHLTFHPFSRDEFNKYIAKCGGIISNAGFELPSEALQIDKKMLLEPMRGQTEQISNANILNHYNWCQTAHKIEAHHIKTWLQTDHAQKIVWPNVADILVDWIKADTPDSLPELSNKLWAQIEA